MLFEFKYNPGQKFLGHPGKNTRKIGYLWKMPGVSLLLCLYMYHTVLVTALPLSLLSNLESACNDSGCEGPFISTLHGGRRGGCANLRCFCESVPRLLARIVGTWKFNVISQGSRAGTSGALYFRFLRAIFFWWMRWNTKLTYCLF